MSNARDRFLEAHRAHGYNSRPSGSGYVGQCTAHDDSTPSMSITYENGKLLLCCQVGCSTKDIVEAVGLKLSDLFDEPLHAKPGRQRVVAEYEYQDARGAVLFVKQRIEPGKDGRAKDFKIYRPMPGGKKSWGLKGVEARPLYRAGRLQEAREKNRTVYVLEGERDVDTAERLGLIAVCNFDGAAGAGQRTKWKPEYGDALQGLRVDIVQDNDEAGRAHAAAAYRDLVGKAASVRIVQGRVEDEHSDFSDHIEAGFGLDDLVEVPAPEDSAEATKSRGHLRAVPTQTQRAPKTAGATALAAEPSVEVGFSFAVFGLPKGISVPKQYRVTSSSIGVRRGAEEDDSWTRVAYGPLVVTRTFYDPDDEQSIELSWIDRGKVVSRVVPRDVAKRGRELIKQLGSANLPVIEADARLVERWLAEFEVSNRDLIPDEYLARHLGWQPDGTFVASPHGPVKVEVLHEEQRARARAFGPHGTLAGWQRTVQEVAEYQVPRVVIAASLAAPLLRPLGVSSFTVDVSSRSTKGKTTCLQCGLSVWANPSEQADAMANWRTTLFAIEKTLNLVRGLVTVLDETMAVDDETLIDQVLYQLPMNHGKSRSGGYASMLPWETILLSSGERPALSFTTAQGAAARILGTTKPPFGDNGGDVAVRVREGVLANYGHAGPAFAERLQHLLGQEGGAARLKRRHQELREQFKGSNDMTGRRAPMVALLALAEELASDWGILPYRPMPAEVWQGLFAAHNPTDNRPEMAMDVVREYIASHPWELYPGIQDRPPMRGWIGARKQTKDGETRVAIFQKRLEAILSEANYSLAAVEEGWLASKYLEERDTCRPKHKIPTRVDGEQARCYIFTAAALRIADADEEAS